MYAPFIYPLPLPKNSHPWMIFGDFIPHTSFQKLMNPALSDEAELQNLLSWVCIHIGRLLPQLYVSYSEHSLFFSSYCWLFIKFCNVHLQYNCDFVRFLICMSHDVTLDQYFIQSLWEQGWWRWFSSSGGTSSTLLRPTKHKVSSRAVTTGHV